MNLAMNVSGVMPVYFYGEYSGLNILIPGGNRRNASAWLAGTARATAL